MTARFYMSLKKYNFIQDSRLIGFFELPNESEGVYIENEGIMRGVDYRNPDAKLIDDNPYIMISIQPDP